MIQVSLISQFPIYLELRVQLVDIITGILGGWFQIYWELEDQGSFGVSTALLWVL